MKREISLLLVFVLLLGLLCGCGQDNSTLDASLEWADGVIADGVYTNECLDLTFQIPENWIQASVEETRTILNADPNDNSTVYDVLLGPRDMSGLMAILCLDLRQQIGGTSMTADDLLDQVKEEMLDSAELGDASFSETESVSLCGREYRGVILTASVPGMGITVTERILLSRLGKDKIVMLTVRASTETQLEYYMAHFTDDPDSIPAPPAEATPEPTAVFTRGEHSDSSYTSAFLGLRFDAPEGWVFGTDRELAELTGLSVEDEIFNDPAALEALFAQQSTIYDMTASAPDSSAVIQLALDNLSYVIGGSSLTEEEYAEIIAGQLRSSGYPYEIGDTDLQELAGKSFVVVPASLEDYGVCQYLYIARVKGYMLVITFTGADSSVLDYTDCFTDF